MKTNILLKIESKMTNGSISRSDLKAIQQHPATTAADSYTLHKILNTNGGLGKQSFDLKNDLQAFVVKPYTNSEVIKLLNAKLTLMSYSEGQGMYRRELLDVINDVRVPDQMKVKLHSVIKSGGTKDYFLVKDFTAVLK